MIMSQMRGPSVTTARRMALSKHPPSRLNPTVSAWLAHKGESTLMENTQEELKAHLMQTDEEFRRLNEQHTKFHAQLEALEAKSHLTPEEELEEHRLKKLKLRIKDQMNEIVSRHRAQNVA
jgi:uncharacterized protein YdcH (DUF465 family)